MSHAAKKINPPNNVKEIKINNINADFIFQPNEWHLIYL